MNFETRWLAAGAVLLLAGCGDYRPNSADMAWHMYSYSIPQGQEEVAAWAQAPESPFRNEKLRQAKKSMKWDRERLCDYVYEAEFLNKSPDGTWWVRLLRYGTLDRLPPHDCPPVK